MFPHFKTLRAHGISSKQEFRAWCLRVRPDNPSARDAAESQRVIAAYNALKEDGDPFRDVALEERAKGHMSLHRLLNLCTAIVVGTEGNACWHGRHQLSDNSLCFYHQCRDNLVFVPRGANPVAFFDRESGLGEEDRRADMCAGVLKEARGVCRNKRGPGDWFCAAHRRQQHPDRPVQAAFRVGGGTRVVEFGTYVRFVEEMIGGEAVLQELIPSAKISMLLREEEEEEPPEFLVR